MRQSLAVSGLAVLLGGCTIIFNPDHITGEYDAAPDMFVPPPIDANPAALTLTQVDSAPLLEGQGAENSRPAVLVIEGTNIAADATITITGSSDVTYGASVVATSTSDLIAAPVTAIVDGGLADGTTVPLTVTVTQGNGQGGMVSATIAWQLNGLDELTDPASVDTTVIPPKLYSHVMASSIAFTGTDPLLVRAVAGVTITGALAVDASGTTAGPAGGAGGASKDDGGGIAPGKAGSSSVGGGGGGFVMMGGDSTGGAVIGQPQITAYATNSGSGGGGGTGAAGGGAGGTIELTAGGDLMVTTISSQGAVGAAAGLGSGGGGGTGGVIVLRGGHSTTFGALNVSGNGGGNGTLGVGTKGGQGSNGRARVDSGVVTIPSALGPANRGAMFDTTVALTTQTSHLAVTIYGTASYSYDLQLADLNFTAIGAPMTFNFGSTTYTGSFTLNKGLNHLCVVPTGSGLGNPESRNCIDVAYLP